MLEVARGEDVVDPVLGLILVHRDLLEHDLALGVDLRVAWAEQHLGEQLERAVRVYVEQPPVEVGRLLARRSVHRCPQAVEDLRDLDRRVSLGPLEQEVLEEMGDAGVSGVLIARADPHPHPERHGTHRGNRLGDDVDPCGKLAELDAGRERLGRPVRAHRRPWRRRPPSPSRERRRPSRPRPRPPPSLPRRGPESPVPTSVSSAAALPSTAGSSLRRNPMRPRSRSTSTTVTSSSSPGFNTSSTAPTRSPGLTFEMCRSPSVPLVSSTNAPKAVVFTTLPVNLSPTSASLVIDWMRSMQASTSSPDAA